MSKLAIFQKEAMDGYEMVVQIDELKKNGDKLTINAKDIGELVISIMHVVVYGEFVKQHFVEADMDDYKNENEYLEFANHAKLCHEVNQSKIPTMIATDLAHSKYPGDRVKGSKFYKICQNIVMEKFRDAVRSSHKFELA